MRVRTRRLRVRRELCKEYKLQNDKRALGLHAHAPLLRHVPAPCTRITHTPCHPAIMHYTGQKRIRALCLCVRGKA